MRLGIGSQKFLANFFQVKKWPVKSLGLPKKGIFEPSG